MTRHSLSPNREPTACQKMAITKVQLMNQWVYWEYLQGIWTKSYYQQQKWLKDSTIKKVHQNIGDTAHNVGNLECAIQPAMKHSWEYSTTWLGNRNRPN